MIFSVILLKTLCTNKIQTPKPYFVKPLVPKTGNVEKEENMGMEGGQKVPYCLKRLLPDYGRF